MSTLPLSPAISLPRLPGIDVSSYQGPIDWTLLAPHIRFAFIKATDGARIVDSRLADNVKGAIDNGVPFGLYHFYRNSGSPECDHFLEIFSKYPSQLPPVLDLEVHPPTETMGSLIPNAHGFLAAVSAHARPMIYTSPFYASTYLDPDFAQYPLWVAHYTHAAQPIMTQWKVWDFWQWSADGKLPGILEPVDLDWCLDEPTLDSLMRVPT